MFIYKDWERFCRKLDKAGIHSMTADKKLKNSDKEFLILKHDVETNPKKALKLAEIEAKYGHKGTYYFQFYLIESFKNIEILNKIKALGHEVSYHHDVMDANGGDIEKAIDNFKNSINVFKNNGFEIETVCQHGNPIVNRIGYFSNRDFFRNEKVKEMFSDISEIMVDYKTRININYKYISDAGYKWKVIFDPETNDITDSEDKNVCLDNLDNVFNFIKKEKAVILSTHPHRWYKNKTNAFLKDGLFRLIKKFAKFAIKIPMVKKIMEKFYFLAKKF